nr:phage virion morphogenesis protein [Pseudomonas sp. MOIL14HWK12:I2]
MADLKALETWLSTLLQKLNCRGQAQLARKPALQLRRSQHQRIRTQVNPDGSPFEARKPRDLRDKKRRIKRRMFEKLKMGRYLKAKGSPQQAVIGFAGRVSRIARVHQYGLPDQAERNLPVIRYAKREILGLSRRDLFSLNDLFNDLIVSQGVPNNL